MSALPFTAFNFAVEIVRSDGSAPLVSAAFSECDGLEIGMEVKTIREGGANDRQIRLAGPATVGQLTLKRGMTDESLDLWLRPGPEPSGQPIRLPFEQLSAGVSYAVDGASTDVLLVADDDGRAHMDLAVTAPLRLRLRPCTSVSDVAVAGEGGA